MTIRPVSAFLLPLCAALACAACAPRTPGAGPATVAVGDRCTVSIPAGYVKEVSTRQETSYGRGKGGDADYGHIMIRREDHADEFAVAKPAEGWKSVGEAGSPDRAFASLRTLRDPKDAKVTMQVFRVMYPEASVSIAGADAARYDELAGGCLPSGMAPLR